MNKEALDDASAYIAIVQGLATGALVLSIGLLSVPIEIPAPQRSLLIWGWILLVVSIQFGILARGAVVSQKNAENYNVFETTLVVPTFISACACFVSCVFIGIALLGVVSAMPDVDKFAVKNETAAVGAARVALKRQRCVVASKIGSTQLVGGVESNAKGKTWDVRIDSVVAQKRRHGCSAPQRGAFDVLIDAEHGDIVITP